MLKLFIARKWDPQMMDDYFIYCEYGETIIGVCDDNLSNVKILQDVKKNVLCAFENCTNLTSLAYKFTKRLLVVAVMTVLAFHAQAQAIQPGVVMNYNGAQEKTPLSGVELVVVKAGTHVSKSDGTFTLKFNSLKPGDRVVVTSITKNGFELFNKTDVNNWIISRNRVPFTIILVNSSSFNQQKSDLKQLVCDNYKAKYEQKVRELERLRKANKIQENAFLEREKEMRRKMEEFTSNIDAYIDKFVRIDLSEISSEEQTILKLFKEGRVEEAYAAYKDLNLVEKLEDEIESYISITKRMNKDFKDLCDAVLRKVSTFILMDKMEDARQELGSLLETLKPLVEMHPNEFVTQIAAIRYQLGDLALKDYLSDSNDEAKENLEIAEKLYLKLAKNEPELYRAALAMTQEDLGQVFAESGNVKKAEKYYLKALENWKQLLDNTPDDMDNMGKMAQVKHKLGALYEDMYGDEVWDVILSEEKDTTSGNVKRILDIKAKSIAYYTEAIDNYGIVKHHDPYKYYLASAETQKDLGYFLMMYNDYDEAEKVFLSMILNLEEALANNYSADFIDRLADAQIIMADEMRGPDLKEKEKYLTTALDNCLNNLTRSPDLSYTYRRVLDRLSLFYDGIDPSKSVNFLESNYERLCQLCDGNTEPLIHDLKDDVEDRYLNCLKQKDKDRFEKYCTEKLGHYKELFLKKPETHEGKVSYYYRQLRLFYKDAKMASKTEEAYLDEIELWETLCKQYPAQYNSALCDRYLYLGDYYKTLKEVDKAKVYIDKGLGLTKESKQNATDENVVEKNALLLVQQGEMSNDPIVKEKCYLSALENYLLLYRQNPKRYDTDWLSMLEKVGIMYFNRHNYENAETHFKTALEKRMEHFISVPFESDRVWDTLHYLDMTYRAQIESQKSEMMWIDVVNKCDSLTSKTKNWHSETFDILEKAYTNLGSFYIDMSEYDKAISTYSTILEKVCAHQVDFGLFKYNVAKLHETLGNLHCSERNKNQDITQALRHYMDAYDIFDEYPKSHLEELARLQEKMGTACYSNYPKDKSLLNKVEQNLLEASEKYYKLWQYDFGQHDNSPYKEKYLNVQLLLGDLYNDLGEGEKAKKHFSRILDNLEKKGTPKPLYDEMEKRGLLNSLQ